MKPTPETFTKRMLREDASGRHVANRLLIHLGKTDKGHCVPSQLYDAMHAIASDTVVPPQQQVSRSSWRATFARATSFRTLEHAGLRIFSAILPVPNDRAKAENAYQRAEHVIRKAAWRLQFERELGVLIGRTLAEKIMEKK